MSLRTAMQARGTRRLNSSYEVVSTTDKATTIRDLNGLQSVTNDAEAVVSELHARGLLADGRRLFYYDSDGQLDELKHNQYGRFTGFAPGPRGERS